MEQLEQLMTSKEVAKVLRVTKKTLYRWRCSGRLEGVKVGRQYLYKPDDVKRIAEGGTAAQ